MNISKNNIKQGIIYLIISLNNMHLVSAENTLIYNHPQFMNGKLMGIIGIGILLKKYIVPKNKRGSEV